MAPGDEREGQFDDLFEDLDKFFDPDEEAGEGERARDPAPSPDPSPPGGTESLHDEEILPPGWQEVGDLELGMDTGEHPPIEAWPPTGPEEGEEAPSGASEATAGPAETPAERPQDAPGAAGGGGTAEMTGEDWRRLRDVLGEEEQDEELDFLTEEPGPESEESLFAFGGPEGGDAVEEAAPAGAGQEQDEPGPLSVEDLKKAPPVYRDLPGPGSDEPGRPESEPEAAAAAAIASPDSAWSEPAISEVEAAADQLAQEFGATADDTDDDLLVDLHAPSPRTVKVEPEEMTGPSWEEPTSRPLRSEPLGPGGRNLPAAVITAVALVALALITVALRRWAFALVAGGVVLVGQAELYATMQRRGHQPATALGLVMGALVMGAAYFKGEAAMLSMVALALMLSLLWYMAAAPKAREGALGNVACTLLGLIYVPFLAGYILLILTLASGRALMLSVLGLTFLYDAAAFFVGSFWGSRVLAPTISPKKSWEGLIGATVVTFPVAVAILPSIGPIGTWKHALAVALVVAVFAPLGDLAESMLKRDLGVKDMGSILPGHGGILDRIDSVLFVAPAAFYLLRLIF